MYIGKMKKKIVFLLLDTMLFLMILKLCFFSKSCYFHTLKKELEKLLFLFYLKFLNKEIKQNQTFLLFFFHFILSLNFWVPPKNYLFTHQINPELSPNLIKCGSVIYSQVRECSIL